LRLPLDDADVGAFKGGFQERRGAGNGRQHEAADIMAARDMPIRAVDHGTIAKLYVSKAGGRTIYQFDSTGRFAYYYAHLERYAAGLDEGQRILRGEVIGYVGTSGNAPPNAPHLHFAIFVLGPDQKWWRGTPVDPYLVFKN
jgi:murein DD-endopeptidase MepM/ murein hydrolase activator NlpD